MLSNGDHPHTALTPIGQKIDAIALPPRNPIQFPNYHGFDDTFENAFLHLLESQTLRRGYAVVTGDEGHRVQGVVAFFSVTIRLSLFGSHRPASKRLIFRGGRTAGFKGNLFFTPRGTL